MPRTPDPPSRPAQRRDGRDHRAGEGARIPAQVRHARIVEAVRDRGFVAVASIAAEFAVSEMTIRRDLAELEREGHLVRTHGGALTSEGAGGHTVDRDEPLFDARLRRNRDAKERIAAAAANLVKGVRTVAVDVGTTTYLLALRLLDHPNIKVFTNSLRIAALTGAGRGDIYVPGGQVRRDELSICGPTAVAQFGKLWFDIAFVGVSGITSVGLFDYSPEDNELKRVYLSRSSRRVVLCDASKFQHLSLIQVGMLSDVDMLLTDADPPPDLAAALAAAGVEVRIARELPSGSGPAPGGT